MRSAFKLRILQKESYQISLQRAIIQLRDEDLDSKASSDNGSQSNGSQQCKWNLQKLPLHALGRGENPTHLAGGFIANFFLGLELSASSLYGGDALSLPPTAQINLLALPVFDEDDAPEAVHSRVNNRVTAQEEPAREAKNSREDEEPKVALQERKIEPNLLLCQLPPRKRRGTPTLSPNLSRI